MTLQTALARGRALAERDMTDRCVIRRVTGQTTDADGKVTDITAVVYPLHGMDGRCQVQVKGIVGREVDAGDQPVVIGAAQLKLPVLDSPGLRVDDVAEITASPGDPDMVGRSWRIQELFHKSHATSRRVGVRSLHWETP